MKMLNILFEIVCAELHIRIVDTINYMEVHISYEVPETYLYSLKLMVLDIPSNKLFTHVKKYDFNFRDKNQQEYTWNSKKDSV